MLQKVNAYSTVGFESSLLGASAIRTVSILYDELYRHVLMAGSLHSKRKFDECSFHVKKATQIVVVLQESLDLEKGREISSNLENIYQFVQIELVLAIADQTGEKFDSLLKTIETLKDAWKELDGS